MTDIVDSQTRSRMMSSIRGKNTKPELIVRRFLHSKNFRFRLHSKNLPGRPDIVLPKYKVSIFVHGCFWHRHVGCRFATNPDENGDSWQRKFHQNVDRDSRQIRQLIKDGWGVIVIWECSLKAANFDLSWLPSEIQSQRTTYFEWPKPSEELKP